MRNELGNEQGFRKQKPRLTAAMREVHRQSGCGYGRGYECGYGCGYVGSDVQTCRVHPDWFGEASSEWVDENLQGRVSKGNNHDGNDNNCDDEEDEEDDGTSYLIYVEFEDAVGQPPALLSLHTVSRFVTQLCTLLVDSRRGDAGS